MNWDAHVPVNFFLHCHSKVLLLQAIDGNDRLKIINRNFPCVLLPKTLKDAKDSVV